MIIENGTCIYYRGDIANQPATGKIVRSYSNRWGTFYDIEFDDGEEVLGLAVNLVHTRDSGNGSTRFVTLDACHARRKVQLNSR